MVFMETIRISVMVSIVVFFTYFFQQGNDTRTVLHIIDNIELKLDFANLKSQIKLQYVKKIAIRYFPQNRTALICIYVCVCYVGVCDIYCNCCFNDVRFDIEYIAKNKQNAPTVCMHTLCDEV